MIFTTEDQKQILETNKTVDYFLDSASKISLFYEDEAFDDKGELKQPLNESLNKIGHAFHDLNPIFEKYCYSERIWQISTQVFEFKCPIMV